MNTVKKKLVLNCTTREERQRCDEPELPGRLPRITRLMAPPFAVTSYYAAAKFATLNTSPQSATSANRASRKSSA